MGNSVVGRRLHRWAVWLLALAPACTVKCGDNTFPVGDAGTDDGAPLIDAEAGDGAPPLTRVDFAIGGCETVSDAGCEGSAPLELSFAALTSSPVQVHLWQFGDGETSTEATPTHVYRTPGVYSVSLDVEGPGGGLGESKPGWVTVRPGVLGAACGFDSDCDSGECACGEGDGECDAPLGGRGLCVARCPAQTCADPDPGGQCADLGGARGQDWGGLTCLAECAGGCPSGLACRSVRDPSGEWIDACFAIGVTADIGESCITAGGALDDELCSSGECLAEGVRGLCSADCQTITCPTGTECATFNGGLGARCLRICEAGFACDADPWLACEMPGDVSAAGFSVAGAPATGGYCAPRLCDDDPSVCEPGGVCTDGRCVAL